MTISAAGVNGLKERVLAFVRERDSVSFAELAREFVEFREGEHAVCMGAGANVVLWMGLTEEASVAFDLLRRESSVVTLPTTVLTYVVDGHMLKLPIAKTTRPYKTLHWMPVVLRPFEKCPLKIQKMVKASHAA